MGRPLEPVPGVPVSSGVDPGALPSKSGPVGSSPWVEAVLATAEAETVQHRQLLLPECQTFSLSFLGRNLGVTSLV